MNYINITISGVDRAPSWEALQTLIRTALNRDDGRFTRIERTDGGCNYREFGNYEVAYVAGAGEAVKIDLRVVRPGYWATAADKLLGPISA